MLWTSTAPSSLLTDLQQKGIPDATPISHLLAPPGGGGGGGGFLFKLQITDRPHLILHHAFASADCRTLSLRA